MAHLSLTAESLLDHLAGADVDVLRTVCQHALQRLIELEASAVVGAAPYEHSPERTAYRNGHRPKTYDTRVGRLELEIPKLRSGSYSPRCSSRAAALSAPCSRWCRRPTCTA